MIQERYGYGNMKLLSVAIPCYNSEGYMRKCIESLLVGGEDVEILIIDDGSSDGTAEIAQTGRGLKEEVNKYKTHRKIESNRGKI